ncbi:AAA-domain-containing protein [Obba rivulosa]|uniref:AAA-domain-containing protein n=1 Tax=Obba rivulosa TaxID=1052685 RepID=A0A8E2DSI1_9APHY|nr:AAA-domain-containing protein [Obba rivulosa]
MRSQLLARRTRSLINAPPKCHRALLSSTPTLRHPRKDSSISAQTPRLSKRASSSASSPAADPDPAVPPAEASPPTPPPEEAEEKPKRRSRVSAAKETDASPSPQLPAGLNVLWTPEELSSDSATSSSHSLPPPEIFDEILHNLHITLHPQTQHRATYASQAGPLVEPTFALYCPIEGGEHYIDETVRELSRRAGADVVVLDAVQLAAGECGHFGKAAAALQLPSNPLQISSSGSGPRQSDSAVMNDDDDDFDVPVQRVAVTVMTPMQSRAGRIVSSLPRDTSMSRLKAFFDELININPNSESSTSSAQQTRPRIIYIRDFQTLAASASSWYPALLTAVRHRRQGPMTRPTSPVLSPMTIIFGITPSIISQPSSPNSTGPSHQSLINLLMSRQSPSTRHTPSKPTKSEYTEDGSGDRGRERRLMGRLKRWARDAASSPDIPQLSTSSDDLNELNGGGNPDFVVVGGAENLPPGLSSVVRSALAVRSGNTPPRPEGPTQYFRTSILMPASRSLSAEKATRMARRREINELATRMGVAAVGGVLEKPDVIPSLTSDAQEDAELDQKALRMWEEWSGTLELWVNIRRMADRAVGSVIAARTASSSAKPTLESTPIPWSAIYDAWAIDKSAQDVWKTLLEPAQKIARDHPDEVKEEDENDDDEEDIDEIVERVKRDPDLDQHEQRLLGCIVDPASLSTTFNQVHLPPHTIDSVRTIVSLPLLYPAAFQQGILKEHGMTGCLLFGPPGTGKTLVVRALAKEAGCRMLAVSPSDVMDMYVGEGEKLVRSVFSLARRLSPCVVFIDEIDALFGARMSRDSGGAIAHRGVITEFMQEMDGLKSSKEDNVIVIGATNRPFDLDDAVLRRLPRRLLVDLPGEKEREGNEILKILLRDETLSPDVDLKVLAKRTECFSGSDLKHLCVSAALDAVKQLVDVPWRPPRSAGTSAEPQSNESDPEQSTPQATADVPAAQSVTATVQEAPSPASVARTLSSSNFEVALREITPSASESLGSLSGLRKWNDEFGEGRRKRSPQVWGRGLFGFTIQAPNNQDIGKVSAPSTLGPDVASVD